MYRDHDNDLQVSSTHHDDESSLSTHDDDDGRERAIRKHILNEVQATSST